MAEEPFKRIDNAIAAYYRLCGRDNYFRDNGQGQFLYYIENGDFQADDIDDELSGSPTDCMYSDALMDSFPFDISIQTERDKQKELQNVLRHCHKYGRPPLPRSLYPESIQYKEEYIRKRIKIILDILECKDETKEQEGKPKKHRLNIKKISNKQKKKKGDKEDIVQIEETKDIKDSELKPKVKKHEEAEENDEKGKYPDNDDDNDPVTALAHFSQHFGPNGLLQICEIIIRYQMRFSLENNGELDQNLYGILQKWVVNEKHIGIQKDLSLINKFLLTRVIPYTGIIGALPKHKKKISASPKPLQLAVMLLINNFSAEIIKAFKGQKASAFISIDINGIYHKKIWEFMKKNVKDDKKIFIADIAKTKFKVKDDKKDLKYLMNNSYSDHIFGTILESIHKNKGKNRFLVRIYLKLYELDGQYPRVLVCVQDVDEMEKDSLDNSLYDDLTSEEHPSYSYPMALMRRRYVMDIMGITDALQKKSSNSLKNVFKPKYQEEKFSNDENVEYILITYLIYPFKPKKTSKDEKDSPHLYVTKLYLNFAGSIMRINEEDILNVLPLLFNDESNLKLEKKQINEIQEKRRENHAQQFDIDIVIEEQFKRYLALPKSPKSTTSQTSNHSNT